MTTCVWFTCPRDYHKLSESVARVRLLDPDARCVAVVEPHDTPPEGIEHLECIVRAFGRGSHLDGPDAVRGVARTLAQFDGDLVVKLDSDMIVARAFWHDGPALFQRANGSYVGLYALPPCALDPVARCIDDTPHPGPHEAIAVCFRAVVAMHTLRITFTHHRLPAGVFLPDIVRCI